MARSLEICFHSLREKDVAEAFHVTDRTIRNWVKDGCPINQDRSYSLYNVHTWLMDRQKSEFESRIEGGTLEDQKLSKEIEVLDKRIEKMEIENDELKKNTVSKYLYNRAIHTLIEAFTKFFVDVLKRNGLRLRAIPEDKFPQACEELGIQATKHMAQSVKRVEQEQ